MVRTKDETKIKERVLRMDNDYLFKALFRSIEAREMGALILSKITGLDEELLLNADYIGGEIPKKKNHEKAKTSDVIVKIDDNSRIIVEANGFYYQDLYRKNTSYAFANYIEHTPIGTGYGQYPTIILVNIDVFKHFNTTDPISVFEIRNKDGELEVDSYKSYHLILANALNPEYNKDKDLYQFALFMKARDIDGLKSVAIGNECFEKAFRKVEEYMSDNDFLVYYDKEELDKFEKDAFRRDGLEEGLEEGQKLIIQNMMNNGFEIPEISKMINISEEEINKLLG